MDYDRAREWLVGYVKGRALGLYEYGEVEVEGVSDIDCIVVTDEVLDIPEVPEEFGVQFEGRVFAQMKPEHFRKVKILGDINLVKLWGEGFEVDEYDYTLIDILQVMDWLPERIVKLSKVLRDGGDILGYTNSLRYSVDMVKKITGFGTMWSSVFRALRRGWLEDGDEERLLKLAKEGVYIGGLCIDRFSEYVKEYYEPFDGDIELYLYDTWVKLPKVWQTHVVEQAHCGGIVGDEIRKRIRGSGVKGEVELAALISQRMDLCNSMAEFTRKGMYRWGHIL